MTTGEQIAAKAREGITANWATDLLGYCSRWARQVAQRAGVTGNFWGDDAMGTAAKMRAAHIVHNNVNDIQPGDFLLQEFGSNGNGHIGIYLGNGQVAENGYNGKRVISLQQFGGITGVGRVVADIDPYGAYAAGRLPTPTTGSAPRPFSVSSGVETVDARADNRGPFQRGWDGFTQAVGRTADNLNPAEAVSNAVSDTAAKIGEWFSNLWQKIAPYLASIGLGIAALLLLVLGAWAAIEGGK